MYEYPKSIEEAAQTLDKVNPKWAEKIDLAELDMKNGDNCILGQVCGPYLDAMWKIFSIQYPSSIYSNYRDDNIFGTKTDKNLWIAQINKRIKSVRDFKWALEQIDKGQVVKIPGTDGGPGNRLMKNHKSCLAFDNEGSEACVYTIITYLNLVGWKIFEDEIKVKQGSRVMISGIEYVVGKYEVGKLILISIVDGNRWSGPIDIKYGQDVLLSQFDSYKNMGEVKLLKY